MSAAKRTLKAIPDTIKRMLLPDETPLAYELAQQLGPGDAVGLPAPTPASSVTWSTSGLLDPFGGPLDVNVDYLGAKMTGPAAGEARGSIGHRFSVALGVPGAEHLLLTTHRLAVVGGDFENLRFTTRKELIYFSVERGAVRSIELDPRLLQRARVRLDFTDGSRAMAMMGMLFVGAANRFISAHGQ